MNGAGGMGTWALADGGGMVGPTVHKDTLEGPVVQESEGEEDQDERKQEEYLDLTRGRV